MAAYVQSLLDQFHQRTPLRVGSLVVTVFGDAVVPRGGVLSLESLLAVTRAFRIGDGVVRTALSRLVADGWFARWKVGRNSFYRLTPVGAAPFARATERIYAGRPPAWRGSFDLLLLDGADDRAGVRAELAAAGYGMLAPDLMVGIGERAGEGGFLRLAGAPDDLATARRLAARAWPLDAVGARYARFVSAFAPAAEALEAGRQPDDLEALVVRLLLIHEFRRAVLKDPLLPAPLLPEDWAGEAARDLCGRLYRSLAPAAERWLDRHARSDAGALPPPGPAFAARFAAPLRVTENLAI
ncbi:PaaX family transcriptional regulator C-terminal domain-containing protein [Methylobacterium isbiliense]|uniref:Transcriptional repressor PaaX n=1 Tax=Methylobacterium isbiliense TaxID=315478 RepID=A0ABQ4SE25_9HYPH|nr:PaaX family transcriptional regulator C-terminal domain-containing protein [Methylobacterium isbiliense]MDN3625615.1 PaaX family transcriptional regulator C-terminal domain-containing protein [Methylobacterium isbiliense]GJE00050.1 Transcriptional repressor PaaX [Methylobacterium isbiliense]